MLRAAFYLLLCTLIHGAETPPNILIIVADDLRNGAAMCAVQCAELLLNRGVFAEALAG